VDQIPPLPAPASNFLEAIRPWQHAYRYGTFTYVAVNAGAFYALVRGRIALGAFASPTRRSRTHSNRFTADEVELSVTEPHALEALLRAIASGQPFLLGQDSVALLPGPTIHTNHERPMQGAPSQRGYVNRLTLDGMSRWTLLSNPDVDTDLERDLAEHGFRSVEELLDDYGFTLSSTDSLSIEALAEPVAWIDRSSRLSGRTAQVQVHLAPSVSPQVISLAIVGSPTGDRHNRVRQRLSADQLRWESTDPWVGHGTLELPYPVVASCRVMVNNVLHDELPLPDDLVSANRRRALVQLVDPDLKRLSGPLCNPRDDKERREFESGVATLFYMLGFEAVRIGESKKMSDAADIFAMTASGEILLVECTTETLNPRLKLEKLMRRVEDARAALGGRWLDLAPQCITGVIVVPQPAADLNELMRTARQAGILLLAREQIVQALDHTQFAPDADALLARWRAQPLIEVMTQGLDA
jgi:hypothetical protein